MNTRTRGTENNSSTPMINTNFQETVALKKALEWELSLDSRDLRSHAWYHGPLNRQKAEELIHQDGDFLIRDCGSQPDNYVLSCKFKSLMLHFVIKKVVVQPETVYERVQYQFEEEAFDAVPDLITFYVASGKPISVASGARIQYPCNRTYPLSFYGHKIVGNQMSSHIFKNRQLENHQDKKSSYESIVHETVYGEFFYNCRNDSIEEQSKTINKSLFKKKIYKEEQTETEKLKTEYSSSNILDALELSETEKTYSNELHTQVITSNQAKYSGSSNEFEAWSTNILSNFNLANMQSRVFSKNFQFIADSEKQISTCSGLDTDVLALNLPNIGLLKNASKINLNNFKTVLLSNLENKPLDSDVLDIIRNMLTENSPKIIAHHITKIDVLLLINDFPKDEMNILSCCGLEMLTLPHLKSFRQDLIERTQCMKFLVAVTILTCQNDSFRAEMLSKWIQIAIEMKTAIGNLFSFCSIILGICMPQIQKLQKTWHVLRQKHTDCAFTFEAKLRPMLIGMNECTNPQAPNTTVPHVLLYAMLKDRTVFEILNSYNMDGGAFLNNFCISSWESKADDFGMTTYYLHLDSGRQFLKNLSMYKKNAKRLLEETASREDKLLLDIFRTEFHIKFLWGSNGAIACAEDRHSKLDQVLTLMADKFCNISK